MANPTLYIIAGCNGAGKTTASMVVLPEMVDCHEFVNADEIAKGLSPFKPEEVAIEAGRIMLQRIGYLLKNKVTFAIETTLATRSYRKLIADAKKIGYSVVLIFFWLPSPEFAEKRVAQRVQSGGHNIPKDVIHRRYWAGLENLFEIYSNIVDSWSLFENTEETKPIVVNSQIITPETLNKIKSYVRRRKRNLKQ